MMIKYFAPNSLADNGMKEVKKLLKLHMNGAASEQMEKRGLDYELNYGVSFLHLKKIATKLPEQMELAERLWYREVREMMILATLIVPKDKLSIEQCLEWSKLIKNGELVEQISLNLFSKLSYAEELSLQLISQDNDLLKATGYFSLGWFLRLREEGGVDFNDSLRSRLEKDLLTANLPLLRGVGHLLKQIIRVDTEFCDLVSDYSDRLIKQDGVISQQVGLELKEEIKYLKES
ncbi:hypothetical protein DMA11_10475 [Marinilabiliaceae bacterium JC017]|nr:hypothetical protein DMA11_10475 [Marinilabiliaceae bacterium JC017]